MKPLGLSGSALARQLKVPANRINDILRDRRDISADTALRLARYFGTSARFWLNVQAAYALSRSRPKAAPRFRPRFVRARRDARSERSGGHLTPPPIRP